MDIEFLIQRLEKYLLEESPKIPLSGSRVINEEETRAQLAQEHRLMQEAKQQGAVIRKRAIQEAVSLRADADEYVFNALSQLQGELARLQRVVDNGLQKLEADREQRLQD